MKRNFYKHAVQILLSVCVSSAAFGQWTTDPVNTTHIYNTDLMNGKVGIGIVPEVDDFSGTYPVLKPLLQIKGVSGTTAGTGLLPLPVVKITSTTNSNSLGLGFNNYGWPANPFAYIHTEGRLRLLNTSLENQGQAFFRSKVVIGGTLNALNEVPTPGSYKLYVQGGILTEKIKVALSSDAVNWSDFVFDEEYRLRPLEEVEAFVEKNKHLPEIPSADEVYRDGFDLVEMDAKLLMKIEELTLYLIELKKENEQMKERLDRMERSGSKGE